MKLSPSQRSFACKAIATECTTVTPLDALCNLLVLCIIWFRESEMSWVRSFVVLKARLDPSLPSNDNFDRSMDEEALLESYAEVIEKIAESPYTKEHHQQHIAITKQLNLSAELHQAKSLQNQYFTCSDSEPSLLRNDILVLTMTDNDR